MNYRIIVFLMLVIFWGTKAAAQLGPEDVVSKTRQGILALNELQGEVEDYCSGQFPKNEENEEKCFRENLSKLFSTVALKKKVATDPLVLSLVNQCQGQHKPKYTEVWDCIKQIKNEIRGREARGATGAQEAVIKELKKSQKPFVEIDEFCMDKFPNDDDADRQCYQSNLAALSAFLKLKKALFGAKEFQLNDCYITWRPDYKNVLNCIRKPWVTPSKTMKGFKLGIVNWCMKRWPTEKDPEDIKVGECGQSNWDAFWQFRKIKNRGGQATQKTDDCWQKWGPEYTRVLKCLNGEGPAQTPTNSLQTTQTAAAPSPDPALKINRVYENKYSEPQALVTVTNTTGGQVDGIEVKCTFLADGAPMGVDTRISSALQAGESDTIRFWVKEEGLNTDTAKCRVVKIYKF